MEDRIRVAARVRPLSAQEEERGEAVSVYVQDPHTVVARYPAEKGLDVDVSQLGAGTFAFDATFGCPANTDEASLQERVYEEIGRPVLQSALEGISGCLFAYGISGSGKTFSLFGTDDAPGVLPRLAKELLDAKQAYECESGSELSVKAAVLELYNENLVDLLSDTREPLRLFENTREGVVVPGLSEADVGSKDELDGLLDFALQGRSVGATGANAYSSRSHVLIQLKVHRIGSESSTWAKIHLIDLAGSERQKRSKSEGTRMKEGIHINVSLSALGLVISRLSDIAQGKQHCSVPFRDSKLTFLLKDSLAGNSRTQMLVALSPSASTHDESISTLRFAQSVKRIRTRAVADIVKEDPNARDVRFLQAEVERLQTELNALRPPDAAPSAPSPLTYSWQAGGAAQSAAEIQGSVSSKSAGPFRHLEGQYLSPMRRLIEIGADGSVNFLGGSRHRPIRILPPAAAEAVADGSIVGPVRLRCDGDPDYKYTLVAQEEGALVWRAEGGEGSAMAEVRWQRVTGKPDGEVALALRILQQLSGESRSLGHVCGAFPILAFNVSAAAALEAIDTLVSLCTGIDEANALLDNGASWAPGGHHLLRQLEATWLAPEPNPDIPPRDLLHVKVLDLSSDGLHRLAQILSADEFWRQLDALRKDADELEPLTAPSLKQRFDALWAAAEQGCGQAAVSPLPRSTAIWQRAPLSGSASNGKSPSTLQDSSPSQFLPPTPSQTELRTRGHVAAQSLPHGFVKILSAFERTEDLDLRHDGMDLRGWPRGTADGQDELLMWKPLDLSSILPEDAADNAGLIQEELADPLMGACLDQEQAVAPPQTPMFGEPTAAGGLSAALRRIGRPSAAIGAGAAGGSACAAAKCASLSPRPPAIPRPQTLAVPLANSWASPSSSSHGSFPGTSAYTPMQRIFVAHGSASGAGRQSSRTRSEDRGRGRDASAIGTSPSSVSQPRSRTPSSVGGSRRRSHSAASMRKKGGPAGGGDFIGSSRAFDKNSLRLRNGGIFIDALAKWRVAHASMPSVAPRRLLPGMCAVYVRKRPMFERETRRSDFDVLTVVSGAPASQQPSAQGVEEQGIAQEIVHHACMFDKSLVIPFISHTMFPFDGVFDVGSSNEDVYRVVGRPLLQNALSGNLATLFIFGQTGSGKTYTMRAIERLVVTELFEHMEADAKVTLTYFELAGRKALDLLTEQKAEIRLREEEDGCFRPHDCVEAEVSDGEALLRVMGEAATRRATDATTVNSVSSRSHAVCSIGIPSRGGAKQGRLLLVDCAGTERARDSLFFKGQHQKESAEINSSLFALKDCIRSRQAAIHRQGGLAQDGPPLKLTSVRASPLTKVLAESLISTAAQLAAVATVSPNATDAEHTIDTLRTVYTLSGRGEARVGELKQMLD